MLAAPLASTHWMPAAHHCDSQKVPDVAMSPGGAATVLRTAVPGEGLGSHSEL